jgi:hypothetical protein
MEIDRLQNADKTYLDEGIALLELARGRTEAVCQARAAGKTPPAKLLAIELHVGAWGRGRYFPPTI